MKLPSANPVVVELQTRIRGKKSKVKNFYKGEIRLWNFSFKYESMIEKTPGLFTSVDTSIRILPF